MLSERDFLFRLIRWKHLRFFPGNGLTLRQRLEMDPSPGNRFVSYQEILLSSKSRFKRSGGIVATVGMSAIGFLGMVGLDALGILLPISHDFRLVLDLLAAICCAIHFDAFYPGNGNNLLMLAYIALSTWGSFYWTVTYSVLALDQWILTIDFDRAFGGKPNQ